MGYVDRSEHEYIGVAVVELLFVNKESVFVVDVYEACHDSFRTRTRAL